MTPTIAANQELSSCRLPEQPSLIAELRPEAYPSSNALFSPPIPSASSHTLVTDLARGVVSNRPEWLATCRWCLGVIYRPAPTSGWQHVHQGLIVCRHPLPGASPGAMAEPLDPNNPVADLQRVVALISLTSRFLTSNETS